MSSFAFASGPQGTGGAMSPANALQLQSQSQPPPWMGNQYERCDNSCLYDKANENLSIQALYVQNEFSLLVEGFGKAKEEDQKQYLQQYIPHFCMGDEDARTCLDRYGEVQGKLLTEIRYFIVQNQNSAAMLKSGKDAPPPIAQVQEANAQPKIPQVPYIESTKDMMKESEKFRYLSSPAYVKWLEDNKNPIPSPAEFVRVSPVPRNPANPTEGTYLKVLTDAKGNPIPDVEQYKAALKAYNGKQADIQRDMGNYVTVKERSAPRRPGKEVGTPDSRGLEKVAYQEARNTAQSSANTVMGMPGFGIPMPKAPAPIARAQVQGTSQNPARTPTSTTPAPAHSSPATKPSSSSPQYQVPGQSVQVTAGDSTHTPTYNDRLSTDGDVLAAPFRPTTENQNNTLTVGVDSDQLQGEVNTMIENITH